MVPKTQTKSHSIEWLLLYTFMIENYISIVAGRTIVTFAKLIVTIRAIQKFL